MRNEAEGGQARRTAPVLAVLISYRVPIEHAQGILVFILLHLYRKLLTAELDGLLFYEEGDTSIHLPWESLHVRLRKPRWTLKFLLRCNRKPASPPVPGV